MIDLVRLAMGPIPVDVEFANNDDVVLAGDGKIATADVRRIRIRGIVISRIMRLVIPAFVVERLGLETSGTSKVLYANGRTAQRPIARGVHLTCAGRDAVFNAIVQPDCTSAFIGAIVLQELDCVVDSLAEKLLPRDPKQIICEIG